MSRVVVLSIDGMRPEFYLSDRYGAPTLKRLAAEGAAASGLVTIFPTLTFPAHTTMVTGVLPMRHGIVSNTIFSWEKGPTPEWYFWASHIRTPTLWQLARRAGRSTALLRWPVTVGAEVDWLIPEIFSTEQFGNAQVSLEVTLRNSTPGLVQEVFANFDLSPAVLMNDKSYQWHDNWVRLAALHLLERKQPDLRMLHLISLDKVQHDYGRDSEPLRAALTLLDSMVKSIVEVLDLKTTSLFILGDHGFVNFSKMLKINLPFVERGWITLERGEPVSWRAFAHADGGQAAIYCRERGLDHSVLELLHHSAGRMYKVLGRAALDRLGAYPGALCALDALDGFTFSAEFTGDFVSAIAQERGHHGGLPTRPGLEAGLIAAGAGTVPGTRLGAVNILNVAATLARRLGLGAHFGEVGMGLLR